MTNELAIREAHEVEPMFDITPDEARRALQSIRRFQAVVQAELIKGHDYGTIPGTDKPTLFKPGAEKLAKLLKCADKYEIEECKEDWEKPFFYYRIKCRLVLIGTDVLISEGIGSANSMEAKWRYRWVFESEIPEGVDKKSLRKRQGTSKKTGRKYTQYRIENADIYDQVNTIQKVCKKRSLVDATLSAGRLSDLFTQDIEEISGYVEAEDAEFEDVGTPPKEKPPQDNGNPPADSGEAGEAGKADKLFAEIREVLEAAGHDATFIERRMEGLKLQDADSLKRILEVERKRLKNGKEEK